MARSRWKFLYFSNSIWKKVFLYNKKRSAKKYFKIIYERSSFIPKCFKYLYVRVHKGANFRKFWSMPYLEGSRFGELAFTRKPYHFPLKKKKAKK